MGCRKLSFSALVFSWCAVSVHGQTAPSADDRDEILAAIRRYALNYALTLPDYTCTRITHQKISAVIMMYAVNPELTGQHPDNVPSWSVDIKEELTVAGSREHYKVLKTDTNFPRGIKFADEAFGTISVHEFSAALARIFAPENGANFERVRSNKLRGRPVIVYSFEIPHAHGAHVYDNVEHRDEVVGYKGLIYADAETRAVLRVEAHLYDFPSESEFRGVDFTLDYKAVKVGEREFVLPLRFELEWHRHKPGTLAKGRTLPQESNVEAEYGNYRIFSAESAATYGGADSQVDIHSAISFGDIVSPEKK